MKVIHINSSAARCPSASRRARVARCFPSPDRGAPRWDGGTPARAICPARFAAPASRRQARDTNHTARSDPPSADEGREFVSDDSETVRHSSHALYGHVRQACTVRQLPGSAVVQCGLASSARAHRVQRQQAARRAVDHVLQRRVHQLHHLGQVAVTRSRGRETSTRVKKAANKQLAEMFKATCQCTPRRFKSQPACLLCKRVQCPPLTACSPRGNAAAVPCHQAHPTTHQAVTRRLQTCRQQPDHLQAGVRITEFAWQSPLRNECSEPSKAVAQVALPNHVHPQTKTQRHLRWGADIGPAPPPLAPARTTAAPRTAPPGRRRRPPPPAPAPPPSPPGRLLAAPTAL